MRRESLMRNLFLILIVALALVAAPVLADGGQGTPEACPDAATEVGEPRSKAARPIAAEASGRAEPRAGEPRSRSRWHSLLPGMMK
jgi:hypothetical protein